MSPATVASRLRLTEGQLYSCVITLGVAALLATGLGDVHGVSSAALAQPPLPLPSAQEPPPVVVATPAAPPFAGPSLDLPVGVGVPAPAPIPAPWTEPDVPVIPQVPQTPVPTPKPEPCDNQAVMDAGRTVVTTLDGATGGQLPDKDLLAALGTVTGCDPTDPAVLAVGLLVGAGHTAPDPGLPPPPPLVPFLEIPGPVVASLQPVRAELDTVCGLIGMGNTVTSLFVWAYPTPVPQLTAQVMFQALSACGQVRQP